ncbi:cytoplasmic dynein 2 light intermediate chain 1-like [Tubulanus polymorphus]|uniref:cytoplasmic dynein 2 light intermediate chain 1-like n=1 Tax=Tubulanus polymorphus TaxID=672921 RepID=UPI003DA5E5FF
MSSKGDTLWEIAISKSKTNAVKDSSSAEESLSKKANNRSSDEASVLVTGSKNSGKTSIILRFLDRDEAPKPTTSLEYTFGRRAKGHNMAKDVGHIWELGGGIWLSRLIDIPINANTIKSISLVLVLDLSLPNELWITLEKLLQSAKSRINEILSETKGMNIKDELKRRALERVGEDHPDRDLMDLFPIPLVIIGSKYDLFQNFDPEKRKVICKTLRFIAHSKGATLQFCSSKQESLLNKSRTLITHLVFGTAASKTLQVDHNKPLMIPAGADSLQQIGSPPLPEGDLGRLNARSPLDLWKHAFTSSFPQEESSNPANVEDPAKDPQYAEIAVDNMRAQKNEELERYRKMCERRARETAQIGYSDGF